MDLLEDLKRLQGLEQKKKGTLLPRAVLILATVALVAVMIVRLQYQNDRIERSEASPFQRAVLVRKFSDVPRPLPVVVTAAMAARPIMATTAEALAEAKPPPSQGMLDREEAARPDPPEQPDLEKAIDMLLKRRSPKY
jgi:hypothetical protein